MQLDNFHQNNLGRQISSRNPLVGKVVLLIGNDTAVLKKLVMQLAQKGADIVLFCRQQSTEALQTLKRNVEAMGQRLILFSEKELLPEKETISPADHLIKKITATLGCLDIFIDLSAPRNNLLLPQNEAAQTETVQPIWQMRHAIFAELARAS